MNSFFFFFFHFYFLFFVNFWSYVKCTVALLCRRIPSINLLASDLFILIFFSSEMLNARLLHSLLASILSPPINSSSSRTNNRLLNSIFFFLFSRSIYLSHTFLSVDPSIGCLCGALTLIHHHCQRHRHYHQRVFCRVYWQNAEIIQAYKLGMYGADYVWILHEIVGEPWWHKATNECSQKQLQEVSENLLIVSSHNSIVSNEISYSGLVSVKTQREKKKLHPLHARSNGASYASLETHFKCESKRMLEKCE